MDDFLFKYSQIYYTVFKVVCVCLRQALGEHVWQGEKTFVVIFDATCRETHN